jgi:hypothetical protein
MTLVPNFIESPEDLMPGIDEESGTGQQNEADL